MSVGERVSLSAGEDGHAVNHEEAPAALVPSRRRSWGRASVRRVVAVAASRDFSWTACRRPRIAWNKRGGAPTEQSRSERMSRSTSGGRRALASSQ